MGKMVDVLIVSASKFSLMSEPLSHPKRPNIPEALEKGQISGLPLNGEPERNFVRWLPWLGLAAVIGLRLGWILIGRRR